MQQTKDRSIRNSARLLMLVLIVLICYMLQSIIVPIIFSVILSVLLHPLSDRFEKWGFNRAFSSLTSLLIAILVLAGIGYLIVSQTINIGQDATDIVYKIKSLFMRILEWVSDKFNMSTNDLIQRLESEMGNSAASIGGYATSIINSIGNSLAYGLLVPIMIFFFLYYREFFREFFFRVFSQTPQEKVEEVLSKIYEVLQNYLVGLISVMGIVAVLNTVGLMILGIEYAWFFGILAAMLTIFPYIGIFIGSLIPALFALATKDSAWYALGVVLWFQLVQTLEGNFITPKIVGGKASLNPLVSLLSFFLGGMLFGIAGMILALPLLAMLKIIFDSMPQTAPYGFLLSEPDDSYILTEKQTKKRKLNENKKNQKESEKDSTDEID
ncbi:MAG: AI-2E family transporter [Flavobacteriaceae bacterium]|jgi:predicted PurR-regulated permease PerM|nr:AI-2E family transporter [Flavobacteriaceae bacterium]